MHKPRASEKPSLSSADLFLNGSLESHALASVTKCRLPDPGMAWRQEPSQYSDRFRPFCSVNLLLFNQSCFKFLLIIIDNII